MSFLDEVDNDLRDILQGEFSEDLTLIYTNPATKDELRIDLKGIFDRTFMEVIGEGVTVSSRSSRVSISKTDLDNAITTPFQGIDITEDDPTDWTATIRGINFILRDKAESDGVGILTLYLKKI